MYGGRTKGFVTSYSDPLLCHTWTVWLCADSFLSLGSLIYKIRVIVTKDEITYIRHLTQYLPHSNHSKNLHVPVCICFYAYDNMCALTHARENLKQPLHPHPNSQFLAAFSLSSRVHRILNKSAIWLHTSQKITNHRLKVEQRPEMLALGQVWILRRFMELYKTGNSMAKPGWYSSLHLVSV